MKGLEQHLTDEPNTRETKSTRERKFFVRITYKDGKQEGVPMLTGELYKFITRFNNTSHIESFKVNKINRFGHIT